MSYQEFGKSLLVVCIVRSIFVYKIPVQLLSIHFYSCDYKNVNILIHINKF